MKTVVLFLLGITLSTCSTAAEVNDPVLIYEQIDRPAADAAYHFKQTEQGPLELHFFFPESYDPDRPEPFPAAACFHGGGWTEGPVEWGYDDARFMASRGFVGIAVEYRLANRNDVSALDCMKDANSAFRWLRIYADEFNIDTGKILGMGDSAGGHLVVSSAMFPDYKEASENAEISSIPDAVFCLAPALNVNHDYFQRLLMGEEDAVNCSPFNNVRPGIVPITIVQGTADQVVPFRYTYQFAEKMSLAGNTVEVYPYENGGHDFFYDVPEGIAFWKQTLTDVIYGMDWL